MINVRMRHHEDDDTAALGQVPADRLDWFIEQVRQWGVYVNGEVHKGASGQFVIDEHGAFFEIAVVPLEDE